MLFSITLLLASSSVLAQETSVPIDHRDCHDNENQELVAIWKALNIAAAWEECTTQCSKKIENLTAAQECELCPKQVNIIKEAQNIPNCVANHPDLPMNMNYFERQQNYSTIDTCGNADAEISDIATDLGSDVGDEEGEKTQLRP